jgi:hypothetical protein
MKKMVEGLLVETFPNEQIRAWCTRSRLCGQGSDGNCFEFDDPDKRNLSKNTKSLIKELCFINGIKKASCWPYEIRIEKAKTYTWEELEPIILYLMVKYEVYAER